MQWTMTVSGEDGVPTDVEVEADAAATVGDVAVAIAQLLGQDSSTLFLDGRRLDPDLPATATGVRAGAAVGLGHPAGGAPPPTSALELWVRGGPDAGRRRALSAGPLVVGRGEHADLRLADPDLSASHAQIAVGRDGVTVRDLTSSNGTRVDGAPAAETPQTVAVGAEIELGESVLAVAAPPVRRTTAQPRPDGALVLNRAPRMVPPPAARTVTMPTPPAPRPRGRLPLLSAALPLVLGVAMAVAMHTMVYLLFAALSPVMLLSGSVSERRGARRGRRRDRAEHQSQQEAADRELAEALAAERAERAAAAPDLAEATATAAGPGPRLWERRAADSDALVVRVGRADQPAQVSVVRADGHDHVPPLIPAAPATVDLRAARVVGVCGASPATAGLLRAIVVQLAVWHGPSEVALALLADNDSAAAWQWARWLPHLRRPDGSLRVACDADQRRRLAEELLRVHDESGGRSDAAAPRRPTVVVVDDVDRLDDVPALSALLDRGSDHLQLVCVTERAERLPHQCHTVLKLHGEASTRCQIAAEQRAPVRNVVLDGMSAATAEAAARAVAPYSDTTADRPGQLPTAVSLADQLAIDLAGTAISSGRSTATVIGECGRGPFVVDLAQDGPHALIAGTTGSGKSELLQTIVASLAVRNRPDALNFVLIDYKGGAAFQECERLPHTVGMVTDLDPHLTERALTSLTAELKRREQLLAAAGAVDIDAFWRAAPETPLARLVLVVDEFATLVDELPEFVDGLVGIAMRGRSLGVHLILATQRPSGVVSPVIRANTNLRIALRVTDDAESADVIGSSAAARIAKTRPGRAFARIGAEPPVEFQAARVAAVTPARRTQPRVQLSPWAAAAQPAPPPAPDERAASDLQRIAAAAASAARRSGVDAPPSPWLPPLPELVDLDELPHRAAQPTAAGAPPFGLADRPAAQRREIASLPFGVASAMAVVGGPRSGRTTALRTLIASAAAQHAADDLHIYVLDCAGGALGVAEELPHCGAACGRHDIARGDRVLTRLAAELDRRLLVLAHDGVSSVAEQRARPSAAPRLPWLLLVIDGWDAFEAEYGAIDHGRPVDTALRLAREGTAAGLHVVAAGDKSMLAGRVGAAMPTKLILRLPDRADYLVAGLRPRDVPDTMPDGRAVLIDSGPARDAEEHPGPLEVQVAVLGRDPRGVTQTAAVRAVAERARAQRPDPAGLPFQVRELPRRVAPRDLAGMSPPDPLSVAVGVAGDQAAPAVVRLAADGPGFVIAGPPRSGVTTAVATVAAGLLGRGATIAIVASRRSVLHRFAGRPGVAGVFGPDDAEALLPTLAARPLVALVDDAHTMTDSSATEAVAELLRRDDGRCAVVVGGRSDQLALTFRGLTVAARQSRSGILLQPARSDGELLGAALPHMAAAPWPGRGVLVVDASATPLQVARGEVDGGRGTADDRAPGPVVAAATPLPLPAATGAPG